MLTIVTYLNSDNIILQNVSNHISRNVGNHDFPKCWQFKLSQMLAIIFLDLLATNVRNCFTEMART